MAYEVKKQGSKYASVHNGKTLAEHDTKEEATKHIQDKITGKIRGDKATSSITGTNCSNCRFIGKKSAMANPDPNGGVGGRTAAELKRAKEADLITMPGHTVPVKMAWCDHSKVEMNVNERMCCAFWDSPDAYRPYGAQAIGK